MTDTAQVHTPVAAPAVAPRPYGLFSVVTPVMDADPHWMLGTVWESVACSLPAFTRDECITGEVAEGKVFGDGLCDSWITSKPFVVYAGQKVTGGMSTSEGETRAEARLALVEQRGAEMGLWEQLGSVVPGATVASPQAALALVEQALATGYAGQGVIHMSASMATLLGAQNLVTSGGRATTLVGTPVAIEAGVPVASVDTIVATGAVVVRRGTVLSFSSVDRAINDVLAIAEREYLVGWDCLAVAATVQAP